MGVLLPILNSSISEFLHYKASESLSWVQLEVFKLIHKSFLQWNRKCQWPGVCCMYQLCSPQILTLSHSNAQKNLMWRTGYSGKRTRPTSCISRLSSATRYAPHVGKIDGDLLSINWWLVYRSQLHSGMWLWSSQRQNGRDWALSRGTYTKKWCWRITGICCHWVRLCSFLH